MNPFDRHSDMLRKALAASEALREPAYMQEVRRIQNLISSPDLHHLQQAKLAIAQGHPTLLDMAKLAPSATEALRTTEAAEAWRKQLVLTDDHLKNQQRIQEIVASATAAEEFMRPKATLLAQMAEVAARSAEPRRLVERHLQSWSSVLEERMSLLDVAWATAHDPAFSAAAFGRLSSLGDRLWVDAPFSGATNARVMEAFGAPVAAVANEDPEDREERYDEAGRDSMLVAFPTPAYPQVVVAAGFDLVIPRAPPPIALEAGDATAGYDGQHNAALTHLEQHLRQFVDATLTASLGEKWIEQRVSKDVRQDWAQRQDEARRQGRPVYGLLHYSNFMELGDIICQRQLWRDHFKAVFGHAEFVRTSLLRLHPIRLDLAHSRPITKTDVLFLAAEGLRLLQAIGVIARA